MLLIPLPFVIVVLLFVFAVRLVRGAAERGDDATAFLLLYGVYGLQSLLVGARWGYGMTELLPLMAVVGTAVPPLAYIAFRGLANGRGRPGLSDWPHLGFPFAVILLLLFWRDGVGLLIIIEFAAYGAAVLLLARGGPDRLATARLDGVGPSHRAMTVTGWTLVASALSDIVINIDFAVSGGRYSGLVVSTGTTIGLALFSLAAAFADPGGPERTEAALAEPEEETPEQAGGDASSEDTTIAAEVDRLMRETELYRDVDLNLMRLARRLKRPARAVSQAINRVHGVSVSGYVNGLRVRQAQRLLSETDMAITQVAFEAGFMTKSNFNREFLRGTGMSPSAYRREKKGLISGAEGV